MVKWLIVLRKPIHGWELRKGKTGPTLVKDQGLMVGRETTMDKLALTNIILQMPRRPPVGTSVMYPHGRLCVTPAINRVTSHVTAGNSQNH